MICCSPFERGKVKDEFRLECRLEKIKFNTHVLENSGKPPKYKKTRITGNTTIGLENVEEDVRN